jgi:hypothetical protein
MLPFAAYGAEIHNCFDSFIARVKLEQSTTKEVIIIIMCYRIIF